MGRKAMLHLWWEFRYTTILSESQQKIQVKMCEVWGKKFYIWIMVEP